MKGDGEIVDFGIEVDIEEFRDYFESAPDLGELEQLRKQIEAASDLEKLRPLLQRLGPVRLPGFVRN